MKKGLGARIMESVVTVRFKVFMLLRSVCLTALSVFFFLMSVGTHVEANTLHLRADHPIHYTVKEGDSLWSIAQRFLDSPWEWQELYTNNPAIQNPEKIYPGSVITFGYHSGKPYLYVGEEPYVKLTPKIHSTRVRDPIPTIALNDVRPFLSTSLVLMDSDFAQAPYIVGFEDNRMVGGVGMKTFARGINPNETAYTIFHRGEPYVDPDTKEMLGIAAVDVGQTEVIRPGEISVLQINHSYVPASTGDFLLPVGLFTFEPSFKLKRPDIPVNAKIISVLDGVRIAGTQQIVVLNKGLRNGLHAGDVVSVMRQNQNVTDPYNPKEVVALPSLRIGEMMIFRSFERVSFALVMHATDTIHLHDWVTNPE